MVIYTFSIIVIWEIQILWENLGFGYVGKIHVASSRFVKRPSLPFEHHCL